MNVVETILIAFPVVFSALFIIKTMVFIVREFLGD